MNTESLELLAADRWCWLSLAFSTKLPPSASVFRTLAECTVKCEFRKFKQDLGWCLDDDVNQNDAFLDTKCEKTSCGVEGPPCQAPAEIVPAPTYRPTYKPSLRGSDDDDCIDDEDWSYVTKEGDVFTASASPRRQRGARSASARRRPGGLGRRLQKDVRSYP